MRVDFDPRDLRARLTDALAGHGYVIYYADDSWGKPSQPEAYRIADFVVDFLLDGEDPDEV
jgi:hypothetical protein